MQYNEILAYSRYESDLPIYLYVRDVPCAIDNEEPYGWIILHRIMFARHDDIVNAMQDRYGGKNFRELGETMSYVFPPGTIPDHMPSPTYSLSTPGANVAGPISGELIRIPTSLS